MKEKNKCPTCGDPLDKHPKDSLLDCFKSYAGLTDDDL